ncbi:MAG: YggS family pyridoxal phosphate-dependent enzyme [Prevotella sp.]|nr:YggS family pyridoxal phosphate-dependent enzyme [Prevotella sp.]MCM1075527.1 YggS family pyridoxal phosphate-dependent enzyme [Ruminococcus sp.]
METEIGKHIAEIHSELDDTGVELVAVSKFHPMEAVMQAYNAGQRLFGESRVQELLEKVPNAPADLKWHFIGHLQTNKVRALLPHVALIESVDSIKLLELIDKEAERIGITARILMQVHVAAEETKTGFLPDELIEYFQNRSFENLKATHICGIMGMATNTEDNGRIRDDFRKIRAVYAKISKMCPDLRGFDTVSMGMSGDWQIAIEEGSTLIRVGTAIFGSRQY